MRTDNMMRIYLGDEYTGDSLINFCRYWIKGIKNYDSYETYDEWRVENDLDCLYYDGDLKADTLMSAWTPIKWVADCINRNSGKWLYDEKEIKAAIYYMVRLLSQRKQRLEAVVK